MDSGLTDDLEEDRDQWVCLRLSQHWPRTLQEVVCGKRTVTESRYQQVLQLPPKIVQNRTHEVRLAREVVHDCAVVGSHNPRDAPETQRTEALGARQGDRCRKHVFALVQVSHAAKRSDNFNLALM